MKALIDEQKKSKADAENALKEKERLLDERERSLADQSQKTQAELEEERRKIAEERKKAQEVAANSMGSTPASSKPAPTLVSSANAPVTEVASTNIIKPNAPPKQVEQEISSFASP